MNVSLSRYGQTALLAIGLSLWGAGCDDTKAEVDEAADEAADGLEEAADKVDEAVEDVAEGVDEAVDEAEH